MLAAIGEAIDRFLGVAQAQAAGSPYPERWVESGCWLSNPSQVNHFTLFDAIPNAEWKGCVESRPAPYDVTDQAPNAGNPDTLWVPYFWPDDDDRNNRFVNDFIGDDNTNALYSGTNYRNNRDGRTASVFKYNGRNATIDETPPLTLGPNQACPTPIVPLTNDRDTVTSAITGMSHWYGSGTNTAEGMAWGWRVLSPSVPFTEGEPYGDVRKVVVLMTDGMNWAADNPNAFFRSDYTSYNALNLWRAGWAPTNTRVSATEDPARSNIRNTTNMRAFMDRRLEAVCTNARNAGIEIYTVVFREPDANVRTLMRNCATSEDHAFTAEDSQELIDTFGEIAASIAELRITR
jgi:hypothetical protein